MKAYRCEIVMIVCYNPFNLGKCVVDMFENTFNFCCEVSLIKPVKECDKCRQELNLLHTLVAAVMQNWSFFAATITVARNNYCYGLSKICWDAGTAVQHLRHVPWTTSVIERALGRLIISR